MIRLSFVDETTSGERDAAFALDFPEASLSLRDVIRARIHEEAARHEAAEDATAWRGLVRPVEAETGVGIDIDIDIAGAGKPRGRRVDVDAQCEAAYQAFARNGFLVLVGDKQITDLDEPVTGRSDAEVTFLKLIPLVGG